MNNHRHHMTNFQTAVDLPCSCFTQQQYLVTGFGVPGQLLTVLSVKDVLWSAHPLSAKYKTEDCAFLGVDYVQLVFLEDDHVNYLGVVSLCIIVFECWESI